MKRSITLGLLALSLLVLPGCYAMNIDASGIEPNVYLSAGDVQPERVSQFETKLTGSWLLWGLMPLSQPDMEDAIQREVQRAGGSAVSEVEIRTQQTVVDGLLSVLTLGLYGQRSTFVSGTVVR